MSGKRGVSTVLTSVLMTAVVLSIGIGVWQFTNSAATVMRMDYFEDVMESVDNIKERFAIENVAVNTTQAPSLQVWVINYGEGEVNITKIKISTVGNHTFYYPPDNDPETTPNGVIIAAGGFYRFDVIQSEINIMKGMSVSVRADSSRENRAYEEFRVP